MQKCIKFNETIISQIWGADKPTLTFLYKVTMTTILEYGCRIHSSVSDGPEGQWVTLVGQEWVPPSPPGYDPYLVSKWQVQHM